MDGRGAGAVTGNLVPTEGPSVLSHCRIVALSGLVRAAGRKYAGDLANQHDVEAMLRRQSGPTVIPAHLHFGHAVAVGPIPRLTCAAVFEPRFECTILEKREEVTVRYQCISNGAGAGRPATSTEFIRAEVELRGRFVAISRDRYERRGVKR